MNTGTFAIYTAALILLTGSSATAQKGNSKVTCTDVPLRVTIMPTEGSALSGDGKGSVYTNGVDGVTDTKIGICGKSPAYDALIRVMNSQRSMMFKFPQPTAGSIINGPGPVWADGTTTISAKPLWFVRNILWGRMNGQYTFTTRMIVKMITGPGDNNVYDLRFQPTFVDALDNTPPFTDMNLPSETAVVTVQDTPGTCRSTQGGTLDSWMVTVNAPFIGTLYREDRLHTHSGQYVMPIQLWVEALSCVPSSLTLPPVQ